MRRLYEYHLQGPANKYSRLIYLDADKGKKNTSDQINIPMCKYVDVRT